MAHPKNTNPSNRVAFFYGLPALPLAALSLSAYVYLPTLYATILPPEQLAWIGIVLLATRVIDAASDPLIGVMSDASNTRIGRRRPWLLASVPLIAVSFFAIMTPGDSASISYLTIWSILLALGWTIAIIPHRSWGAELTQDYHGRTRVVAFREAWTVLGTLVAAGLPALLAGMGTTELSEQLFWLAAAVCLLLLPTVVGCAAFVPDQHVDRLEPFDLRKTLSGMRQNPAFLRLLASHILNATANAFPSTLFLLFVAHVLQRPDLQGPLLFLFFLTTLLGIPFWVFVSRRYSKHRTWVIAMSITCASFITVPFIVGPGDLTPYLIIVVIGGLATGADFTLPGSMMADVIDEDRNQSGAQNSGAYFSAMSLNAKLALGISAAIAFGILGMVGFNAGADPFAGENSETALFTLAMIYAFFPTCLKLIAMAIVWNFHKAFHDGLVRSVKSVPAE